MTHKLDPSSIVSFIKPVRRHTVDIIAWGSVLLGAVLVCLACSGWI